MALVPIHQHTADFQGDPITAVIVEGGDIYVPLRPLCEYLGIDWSAQYRRISRDPVLSEVATPCVVVTATQGIPDQRRELLAIPLDYLNGWLFGVNATRVKEELRERLIAYQRDCYRVLAREFQYRTTPPRDSGSALLQVREMGLAIARLAEETMELDGRMATAEDRLEDIHSRLVTVESNLGDSDRVVTQDQASQISQAVKAVAILIGKQSGRNEFGACYGELYRKFGVTSYKLIPASKFDAVMKYLTEWHQTADPDSPVPF